jgi:minor histocompatibility antigen H13
MVSVALKISSPGKLLFPRDPATLKTAASYPFSVLGLGDICVPGIFATLTLALDAFLVQKLSVSDAPAIVPAGPYFIAAVVAYVLGLGSCFGVNFVTSSPQPALFYIVPMLISSTLIVAATRGELSDVIQFQTPRLVAASSSVPAAATVIASAADANCGGDDDAGTIG